MHAKLYWDDIQKKDSDLPGEWPGALAALSGARQVYEIQSHDDYYGFAYAGNDMEKWAVMLLWCGDDRDHPYVLKVYEGREPGFDVGRLRVGM